MTAMDELGKAKAQLRAALLKGIKGTLAGERADVLIDCHQRAVKAAYREKLTAGASSLPRRGDQFEQWLKAQRDEFERGDSVWPVLDYLLDQYRLHAHTGTPLDQHVCDGGTADDCHDCHAQQHPPIRSCDLDHVHDAHNWQTLSTVYGCIGFPARKETDR